MEEWYTAVRNELKNRFEAAQKRTTDENKKKYYEGSYDSSHQDQLDDTLIHLTLFMMDRTEISSEEASCIKRLSKYTNMIPIYTKGDCLNAEDIPARKLEILYNSSLHGVEWFNCKEALKRNQRKQHQLLNSPLGSCPPFLIINANSFEDSKMYRSCKRKYSWGACDIDNPDYTDFLLFYNILIGYLCFPLKERSRVLYQLYTSSQQRTATKSNKSSTDTRATTNSVLDFGIGMAMGVGILGAITIFAKKSNMI